MSDPNAWNDQQRERFLVALQRLDGAPSLDQFSRWCVAHGRAVPAEATEHARSQMLVWLSHLANRDRVSEWVARETT